MLKSVEIKSMFVEYLELSGGGVRIFVVRRGLSKGFPAATR